MNRLVLIDGNAILHRAYHALPPLTTPTGEPIQAVYGFASMLIRLMGDLKPYAMIVAFDRPAPTFRKELYKKYQAKRPKMDDELVSQVEKVHELVRSFHIPILEKDGFEADDIIGTVCQKVIRDTRHVIRKKKQKNVSHITSHESPCIDQIIIVTGDRDILQLVEDDKVFVYMPTKGISEAKLYGEKETIERMGVTPTQIPDFKALAGDPSDNYPGVEGIGPKTAISILEKSGTVDNLYKQLEKNTNLGLSDTIIKRLRDKKDDALLSHELATIKQDVPIEVEIIPLPDELPRQSIEYLQGLGFSSLVKRIQKRNTGVEKDSKEKIRTKDDKKNDDQLSLI